MSYAARAERFLAERRATHQRGEISEESEERGRGDGLISHNSLISQDGFVLCDGCGRRFYGVAGCPPYCPRCCRLRDGVPLFSWEVEPPKPQARRQERPTRRCYSCKTITWWQRPDGGWVCGTCHPQSPASEVGR